MTIQSENKYKEKISTISEELLKRNSEFDAVVKEKDYLIKELKEKYETEKINRETAINKL